MTASLRGVVLLVMTVAIGLTRSAAAFGQADDVPTAAAQCERLAVLGASNTSDIATEVVAAGAFTPPAEAGPGFPTDYSRLPAFCRVTGTIRPSTDSDIRFELWLPADDWNGRFLQTGNGGAAGSIVYGSLVEPLSRGYAVANTDTGHRGGGGDFSWAVGHPEKLIDFQYRAVHELTVLGKALTEAYYARVPEKSYFDGCSTGGRQGLMEAQRYPDDYDAIIAGAPANNWLPLMSLSVEIQRNLGPEGLGFDKLVVLKEAAITACDALDGVTDRVMTEPAQCGFEPASLQCGAEPTAGCLSPGEIAAAQRIYAGIVSADGTQHIPGTGPGSEPLWAAYASPQFSIGTAYYRSVVMDDAEWQPQSFDVDADLALAERVDGGAIGAMDPDLSAFVARGGKLIVYHGTTDGLIPFGNSVNYYESVIKELGAGVTRDSVKLYLVPGMDHCAGGEGAFAVDWLTAMEAWIEHSEAPGVLPAAHPPFVPGPPGAPPRPSQAFTRPVCAYPQVAEYVGSGDPTAAESFACVAR